MSRLPVVDVVDVELSHKGVGACPAPCLCHTDFARSLFRFLGLL